MTFTGFLELWVSLSMQVALVVLATHALTRFTLDVQVACRLWSIGYLSLLGLACTALLLPHPRWLSSLWSELSRPTASEWLLLEAALGRALLVVWLIGATGLWLWMIVQSLRVACFLKTCRAITPDHAALRECRDVLADDTRPASVALLSSSALVSPFCWQFHRPYIVLPEYLLGLAPRELRFIVRHELAHLRTGHPLQVFLQHIVEILFWFHPVVWWAARQVSRCREFACDDAAIDQPAQVADYLRTLLIVVEHSAAESEPTAAALTFGRGQRLVAARAQRLASIARFGWNSHKSRRVFASAAFSWCLVVAGSSTVWVPVNVAASPRSGWSPWPRWSANMLHEFGVSARDFEVYDDRIELHEFLGSGSVDRTANGTRPSVQTFP